MKRFVIFILALSGVLLGFDFAFGLCIDYIRKHAKGGQTHKIETVARGVKHDILIMGSSRACHHYDPRVISCATGMSTFNSGQDGNGIILMYGLLSMNLEHNTPKIIIYDVTPEYDIQVYDDDSNLRYLALLKPFYHHPEIHDLIRDVSPKESVKLLSNLYRYNSNWLTIVNDYFKGQEDPFQGYKPVYNRLSSLSQNQIEESERIIDPIKQRFLQSMIRLVKERGIKLFFVFSPKAGHWDSSVFSPIETLCQAEGIPYFNYYFDEDLSTRPELFNDMYHLNDEGASLFSAKIATEILQEIQASER